MSATRDKTQNIAFVYSNLYQIYRKGKQAAQNASPKTVEPRSTHETARVIKAADAASAAAGPVAIPRIQPHSAPELIGKRIERPEYLKAPANPTIDSLKQNLKTLNDLHSRLRFMLQELEDLVKE